MLSVIVLYSTDRHQQFINTIGCLNDMLDFASCEKILCVDGKTDINPGGWKVLEIERSGQFWRLGAALNMGVEISNGDDIWYLDCDRVLPINFLKSNIPLLEDGLFIFPKYLFTLSKECDLSLLRSMREHPGDFSDYMQPDYRVENIDVSHHRNPFAGCVLFKKRTYWECGGFSPEYEAWGYKDYDFWRKTIKHGCRVLPIECIELHQRHDVSDRGLYELSNLWNYYYYSRKWNLPIIRHERRRYLHPERFKTLGDFVSGVKTGRLL